MNEYLASGRIEAWKGLRDALPEDCPCSAMPPPGRGQDRKLVKNWGVRSVVSL
jgi:hypothetical protein